MTNTPASDPTDNLTSRSLTILWGPGDQWCKVISRSSWRTAVALTLFAILASVATVAIRIFPTGGSEYFVFPSAVLAGLFAAAAVGAFVNSSVAEFNRATASFAHRRRGLSGWRLQSEGAFQQIDRLVIVRVIETSDLDNIPTANAINLLLIAAGKVVPIASQPRHAGEGRVGRGEGEELIDALAKRLSGLTGRPIEEATVSKLFEYSMRKGSKW